MVHGPDRHLVCMPWGLSPAAALRYPINLDIERANSMAKVSPFHSAKPGTRVHHNDNRCTEGNNIESYNRRSGTGGHPLCDHCRRL